MQLRQSELERHFLAIVSQELGVPVPQSTIDAVHEAIESNSLCEANQWLIPLLQRLLNAHLTSEPIEIPWDYPGGEAGLANVLAELEGETWLHVDDYGEGVVWRLPAAGVEVFINRESETSIRNTHTYEVRRTVA
jgi:hypothetical protein